MRADRPNLSEKQRRFVAEYAADGNAVQAYFRAFGRYTSKGTQRTYRAAQVSASQLLSNPMVSAEVEAANREYAARVGVDKERVLRELAAIAFADPDDIYEADPANGGLPAPRPWRDVPPGARKAVQSVKVKRRRLKEKGEATQWELEEVEYRFHPKTDALDKLCKKLGLYAPETKDDADDDRAGGLDAIAHAAAELLRRYPGAGGGPVRPDPGGAPVGAVPGAADGSVSHAG